jgi:hypothetical protein
LLLILGSSPMMEAFLPSSLQGNMALV